MYHHKPHRYIVEHIRTSYPSYHIISYQILYSIFLLFSEKISYLYHHRHLINDTTYLTKHLTSYIVIYLIFFIVYLFELAIYLHILSHISPHILPHISLYISHISAISYLISNHIYSPNDQISHLTSIVARHISMHIPQHHGVRVTAWFLEWKQISSGNLSTLEFVTQK